MDRTAPARPRIWRASVAFFGGWQLNRPARSGLGVSALANPGYLVEIEVIAVKDRK
jgi:enamine deaminase RidA (YjgF/YER057c/UK114 family)